MKYVVASVGEIPPGGRKIVDIGRRSIGIFNLGGEFFALRNKCPHRGAELCRGKLWGIVRSDSPGVFDYQPEKEIISCPHHGWEFHIRTGRSWCEPDRLRTGEYEVAVESGEMLLDDESSEEGPPGRVQGPYVAESIEVTVEDEYLVIELH